MTASRGRILGCLIGGMIACTAPVVRSEVLFYEGFGYPRGEYGSLNNKHATWSGRFNIVDSCLAFENGGIVDTQGNTLRLAQGESVNCYVQLRDLADSRGLEKMAVTYVSFLVQLDRPPLIGSTLFELSHDDGRPLMACGVAPTGFWWNAFSTVDGRRVAPFKVLLNGIPVKTFGAVDFGEQKTFFVALALGESERSDPRIVGCIDAPVRTAPNVLGTAEGLPLERHNRQSRTAKLRLHAPADSVAFFDEIRVGDCAVDIGFKPTNATVPTWMAGISHTAFNPYAVPGASPEQAKSALDDKGQWAESDSSDTRDFSIGDNIVANVMVIKGETGSGTGVVINDGSNTYLYSNLHIVSGNKGVKLLDNSGKTYGVKSFECASDRDLVRLTLSETPSRGLPLTNSVAVGTRVAVCGNAEGADVMRPVFGEVLGIGPQKVETSAEFVQGHSGSPIVTHDGHVIGIATYVTRANTNWVNKDTPFSVARRFGCRIGNVPEWVPVSMRWFAHESEVLRRREQAIRDVFAVLSVWADDPLLGILPLDDELPVKLQRWIRDHNAWVRKNRQRSIGRNLSQAMQRDMQMDYDRLHSTVKGMLDMKEPRWHLPQFKEQWDNLDDFEHFLWVIMDHVQEVFRTR